MHLPWDRLTGKRALGALALFGAFGLTWAAVRGAPEMVSLYAHAPNVVRFTARQARFVRLEVRHASGGQACIDELEVYAEGGSENLAHAVHGAKATASSCLPGFAIHRIRNLNDGLYGNRHSWIAATSEPGEWAQIELAAPAAVDRIVYSRDRQGEYADRVVDDLRVLTSMDGKTWEAAAELTGRVVAVNTSAPSVTAPFGQQHARYVRLCVLGTSDGAPPALDEVQVYGKEPELDLASKPAGGSVAVSSTSAGSAAALNDGRFGPDAGWRAARPERQWVQVNLPGRVEVNRLVFSRDRTGSRRDGAPAVYEVRISLDGRRWKTVVRWGQPPVAWPAPAPSIAGGPDSALLSAYVGEELASLKAYGRADCDPGLTEYVRVWQYPEHVAEDILPLPELPSAPDLAAPAPAGAWSRASRGVVRAAFYAPFSVGPMIEQSVWAGRSGASVYVSVQANRMLSSHVAVLSSGDWSGCGVLAMEGQGLRFRRYAYRPDGALAVSDDQAVEGRVDADAGVVTARLPAGWFPGLAHTGLRVGLGLGGKHTSPVGRPVIFECSDLGVAQAGSPVGDIVAYRLSLATGSAPRTVSLTAHGATRSVALQPGRTVGIALPTRRGPLGPEAAVTVQDGAAIWQAHAFRYDAAEPALEQLAGLVARLEAQGVSAAAERAELTRLQSDQSARLAVSPDAQTERQAFLAARTTKRRAFMRLPEMTAAQRILCVRRHPFAPSHNYSDLLDNTGAPGGSLEVVEIPRIGGRLDPEAAATRRLFDAGQGVIRDPAADFAARTVTFAWRKTLSDPFHLMSVGADGSGLKQITDGPFHDFYPTPMPDGDLAFVSTRCRARYLCWRPQAYVLFKRQKAGAIAPLSYANLSEWAPSIMQDGRLLWTRSEYQDKGADFNHTLWSIRPDGTDCDLVFGNSIIQPNGYVGGREMPGGGSLCCTLISHFGDLNGPIALIDLSKDKSDASAIRSITPEVPWPGSPPGEECFRDPYPISRDVLLVSHAPDRKFGVYAIDRFGNRELLYADPAISVMSPTALRPMRPPVSPATVARTGSDEAELFVADIYKGLERNVKRGSVKWIRVSQEVRADLEQISPGRYRDDHPDFTDWYATPIHLVNGPYGWPSYVAKASWGLVPVAPDGSARFRVPGGKMLYFSVLDAGFNEVQRMRSIVQLAPGERRSCIGCHESRTKSPSRGVRPTGVRLAQVQRASWEGAPFSYERVVQPVLDKHCVRCHNSASGDGLDLTGTLAEDRVPESYRTIISQGLVHYHDWSYNPGGNEKAAPLTFGSVRSKLVKLVDSGHQGVRLSRDETLRLKAWIDLNCPLWPDYIHRPERPISGRVAGR